MDTDLSSAQSSRVPERANRLCDGLLFPKEDLFLFPFLSFSIPFFVFSRTRTSSPVTKSTVTVVGSAVRLVHRSVSAVPTELVRGA